MTGSGAPSPRESLADRARATGREVAGAVDVIADWSWEYGQTAVLELSGGDGVRVVAKAHRDRRHYDQEVRAYRRWTSSLGSHAPELLVANDEHMALVVTRIAGTLATELTLDLAGERELHARAGELLRRYHNAEIVEADESYAATRRAQLERWIEQARPGLLARDELEFAELLLGHLEGAGEPVLVPCHRDYWPRNWLVDGDAVNVIDFEASMPGVWSEDLLRLVFGAWVGRPDLEEAFLSGYGGVVAEDAVFQLAAACSYLISGIVWPDLHGDAMAVAAGRARLESFRRRIGAA